MTTSVFIVADAGHTPPTFFKVLTSICIFVYSHYNFIREATMQGRGYGGRVEYALIH